MKLIRHLSYRNLFNTNYRIYCIQFSLPKFGWRINNFLYKYHLSDISYCEDCNKVRYLRKWYRKEMKL